MRGYYTAREVIDQALFTIGDFDKSRYEEAVMYFSASFRDYQLFHGTTITEAWLPVTAIKTINMPDDFIRLVSIGLVLNGEVFTFTLNSRMSSPSAPIENKLIASRGEEDGLAVSVQWGSGSTGVNDGAYFKINDKQRRIELKQAFLDIYNQDLTNEVLVSYLGNNLTDLNNAYIPMDAVNLLVADIALQLTLTMPQPLTAVVNIRQRRYNEEVSKYDALSLPSADELLDVIYQTSGLGLRR